MLTLPLLQSNVVSVGASGAIFGLMGSLLYFGYHYRVYLGTVIKSQIIPLIVLNLLIGFLVTSINNFADMCIVVSIFLLLIYFIKSEAKNARNNIW